MLATLPCMAACAGCALAAAALAASPPQPAQGAAPPCRGDRERCLVRICSSATGITPGRAFAFAFGPVAGVCASASQLSTLRSLERKCPSTSCPRHSQGTRNWIE